jgi:hypothetical protein
LFAILAVSNLEILLTSHQIYSHLGSSLSETTTQAGADNCAISKFGIKRTSLPSIFVTIILKSAKVCDSAFIQYSATVLSYLSLVECVDKYSPLIQITGNTQIPNIHTKPNPIPVGFNHLLLEYNTSS